MNEFVLVCSSNPCLNGGQCFVINNNADFYCLCPANGIVGGKRCDQLLISTTSAMATSKSPFLSSILVTAVAAFIQRHSSVHRPAHQRPVEMVQHVPFRSCRIRSFVLAHWLSMALNVNVRANRTLSTLLLPILVESRLEPMLFEPAHLSEWWYLCRQSERCVRLPMSGILYRDLLRTTNTHHQ